MFKTLIITAAFAALIILETVKCQGLTGSSPVPCDSDTTQELNTDYYMKEAKATNLAIVECIKCICKNGTVQCNWRNESCRQQPPTIANRNTIYRTLSRPVDSKPQSKLSSLITSTPSPSTTSAPTTQPDYEADWERNMQDLQEQKEKERRGLRYRDEEEEEDIYEEETPAPTGETVEETTVKPIVHLTTPDPYESETTTVDYDAEMEKSLDEEKKASEVPIKPAPRNELDRPRLDDKQYKKIESPEEEEEEEEDEEQEGETFTQVFHIKGYPTTARRRTTTPTPPRIKPTSTTQRPRPPTRITPEHVSTRSTLATKPRTRPTTSRPLSKLRLALPSEEMIENQVEASAISIKLNKIWDDQLTTLVIYVVIIIAITWSVVNIFKTIIHCICELMKTK